MSRPSLEHFNIHDEFSKILENAKNLKTLLAQEKERLDSAIFGFGKFLITPFFYKATQRGIITQKNIEIGRGLGALLKKGLNSESINEQDEDGFTILYKSLLYLRDCFATSEISHYDIRIALNIVKHIGNHSINCAEIEDFLFDESKEITIPILIEINHLSSQLLSLTNNDQILKAIVEFNEKATDALKIELDFLQTPFSSHKPSPTSLTENKLFRSFSNGNLFSSENRLSQIIDALDLAESTPEEDPYFDDPKPFINNPKATKPRQTPASTYR